MRQVLTAVALSLVVGCLKSEPMPNPEAPGTEPCTGTRTDNGNGTTTIVCTDGTRDLVCTHPDCSGIASLGVVDTDLTRVILPTLTSADDVSISGNPALTSVSLPALTTVASQLLISHNGALTRVNLPSLTAANGNGVCGCGCYYCCTCSGGLQVHFNAMLEDLSLPALISVSNLGVTSNPALTSVSLPRLTTVELSLFIYDNSSYPQCGAEAILAQLTVGPGYYPFIYGNAMTGCSPRVVCDGDVTITSAQEYAAFVDRGCTSVTGTLTISGTDLTSVSLPGLITVGTIAAGHWDCLIIENNDALTSVSLPALTASGCVSVDDNPALTTLSLPALTSAGEPYFIGPAGLGLAINSNPGLTSVSLPALITVHQVLAIGRIGLFGPNSALTDLSLPALTSADALSIVDNPALTSVSLPALTTVSWFLQFTGNTSYPQCQAEAILAQLVAFTGTANISGNDTTATCPP